MYTILPLLFMVVTIENVAALKGSCSIDAAINWVGNAHMYLFKGDQYGEWNSDKDELGRIGTIKDDWKGIPNNIDAAMTWKQKNYFFKGCHYWRFYKDKTSDGPHSIKDWKIPCNIDAAANFRGKIYFFKGDQYWFKGDENWRFFQGTTSGPNNISAWDSLEGNVDTAIQWLKSGKIYFLKGKKYWRYDKKGKKAAIGIVAGGWRGLLDGDLLPDCQCDCDSCCNKHWEIDSIDFDSDQAKVIKLPAEAVATQVINNRDSTKEGKITFIAEKTVTETKSFTHTTGADVTVGTTFESGVPLIAEAGVSVEVSASYSFEYGKQTSIEKKVSGTFECSGSKGKKMTCKAMLHANKADIPYTMTMKHKTRGCKCPSKGIYTDVSSYSLNLVLKETDKK